MPILSLQNVAKEYSTDGQPVRALDDISLDVAAGEFLALVGRSGCGKSTLLNLAGAMDFPSYGTVLIDGVPTSGLDDAALTILRRNKVGFVFQSFQLLHTLTVYDTHRCTGYEATTAFNIRELPTWFAIGIILAATSVYQSNLYAFIAACERTKTGRSSKCKHGMKSYLETSAV